ISPNTHTVRVSLVHTLEFFKRDRRVLKLLGVEHAPPPQVGERTIGQKQNEPSMFESSFLVSFRFTY
ncbi:MAG: hypothetical protein AAB690_02100, partial [Patescibacteria group bacterium]